MLLTLAESTQVHRNAGHAHLACCCVCVDVQRLPVFVCGHSRHNWDVTAVDKAAQQRGVNARHLAHKPVIKIMIMMWAATQQVEQQQKPQDVCSLAVIAGVPGTINNCRYRPGCLTDSRAARTQQGDDVVASVNSYGTGNKQL
jgi:hypothetical protein